MPDVKHSSFGYSSPVPLDARLLGLSPSVQNVNYQVGDLVAAMAAALPSMGGIALPLVTLNAGVRQVLRAVTEQPTMTIDLAEANLFEVTLTGNRTLANPEGLVKGSMFVVFVKQDATGGRVLSFGPAWSFAPGEALSLAPGVEDIIVGIVRQTTGGDYYISARINAGA